MLTVTQAKALGEADREEGLTDAELRNIAESIVENYGGKVGNTLAAAYRKGAGI